MLLEWCEWFISIAEDQVNFMTKMLSLDDMKARISALVIFRSQFDKGIREEAIVHSSTCSWLAPRRAANSSK